MANHPIHARIDGPIVMIGFGSIGQGTLPLIERHFEYDKSRFVVIDPERQGPRAARRARHPLHQAGRDAGELSRAPDAAADRRRRPGLLRQPFGRYLLARHHAALPRARRALHRHGRSSRGPGFYFDSKLGPEARSNYALRETMPAERAPQARRHHRRLLLRRQSRHGVLVRQASAAQHRRGHQARGQGARRPARIGRSSRRSSASKASISPSATPSAPSSRSRWTCSSTPGRWRASCRRACSRPSSAGARTRNGCRRTAASTKTAARPRSTCCSRAPTRACAPGARRRGPQYGFLVTHNESISIADYFTLRDGEKVDLPADLPLRLSSVQRRRAVAARDVRPRRRVRPSIHILDENEIVDGIDELGVLLYGHRRTPIGMARSFRSRRRARLAPYQNATGLQVTSAVLAGMVWALENPKAGIVEADEMDFRRCLEVQMPYLGPVIGTLHRLDAAHRAARACSPEDIDTRDPWQFRNVLVR